MHRFLKTYFYPVLPKPWGISRGGRDSNGRIAYWTFRLKAWAYELADFFFPKPYSLAALAGFEFQDGLVMVDYGCGPGRYLLQASRLWDRAGASTPSISFLWQFKACRASKTSFRC